MEGASKKNETSLNLWDEKGKQKEKELNDKEMKLK